ncbi:hypothetical protein AMTRI_Chr01g110780 [Amborella trichopoda]|uniref:Uncharacterized protein n=1 Tax=Amborella trichopoda TaxID=13333 RepID=W1PV55_AMBTC|nr:uncharacterized protein LOC110007927 [Amborella trichopoda]XP_020527931.1 uncharacterized protein LOC110007927 [Amborella trichopoda]ERN13917.1 hypothetical protein AMTR_s00021p00107800 [Amborella trichopoda]|eukprot:XP_020527930.1 uncharacterized protein LOC110007927 [Amborella trichopoda]
MGCCFSKKNTLKNPIPDSEYVVEEKVKEVLLEIRNPSFISQLQNNGGTHLQKQSPKAPVHGDESLKAPVHRDQSFKDPTHQGESMKVSTHGDGILKPSIHGHQSFKDSTHRDERLKTLTHGDETLKASISADNESLEISESLNCLSESVSATFGEEREVVSPAKFKMQYVSPTKRRARYMDQRNRVFSNNEEMKGRGNPSPLNRTEQLPVRRLGKSFSERDMGRFQRQEMRRDGNSAANSGRQSRSPVARASPIREKSKITNPTTRIPATERKEALEATKEQEFDKVSSPTANESLENPHVSLECFIFL